MYHGGCSSMVECTTVARETRVQFSPTALFTLRESKCDIGSKSIKCLSSIPCRFDSGRTEGTENFLFSGSPTALFTLRESKCDIGSKSIKCLSSIPCRFDSGRTEGTENFLFFGSPITMNFLNNNEGKNDIN